MHLSKEKRYGISGRSLALKRVSVESAEPALGGDVNSDLEREAEACAICTVVMTQTEASVLVSIPGLLDIKLEKKKGPQSIKVEDGL